MEDLKAEDVVDVEKLCENYPEIELNERKLELFLNGVKLTVATEDGIYQVFHAQKFVGLGVVEKGLIKRDVIFLFS